MILINYLKTFFQKQRYSKSVSLFSVWDKTKFPKEVYIEPGVRLRDVTIGKYSRIRFLSTIYHAEIGKYPVVSKNGRI